MSSSDDEGLGEEYLFKIDDDFVTETISIGGTSTKRIAIGCGHTNEGLFVGAAGLLGLDGGSLSFPPQLK
ncbi:hypothetical protein ACFX12_000980 [Malus domestica]